VSGLFETFENFLHKNKNTHNIFANIASFYFAGTKFHGGRYCVFPGMKDGKPYAIPFILQSDDLLIALDPLGRVIQLKSKGERHSKPAFSGF
jgi:hypothetical protein